ncbi:MAG: transporter ATP-binding protein [Acidimicrobiales bacterium]|nr:transporter ATP-binding protein [Acidimicrobiales bacterium]
MAVVIRVSDVSKEFKLHHDKSLKERIINLRRTETIEPFWALKHVGFELEQSHTLGLIGANGSGKSTLLKLIGGILTPTHGYVERRGRIAALLELGAGFHSDLTGRENVFMNASILGLTRKQTEAYFDAIVDFSGIEQFIDNQVKYYSSGMYVRLAFAVAVHVEPEILLVDEVLAVGDEPFQRKCMEKIKGFQREGRTIIFVTHGLDTVRQLCDRVIMLEKGEVLVDGKPTEALRAFRERYAPEVDADEEGDIRGTRQIEIVEMRFTDGDGQPKERFEPGDRLGFDVVLDPHEPIDDPVVGVAIYNHLDTLMYGTNTMLRNVDLGRVDHRKRVRFDFGQVPMVEGQYFVTVAVHNRDETVQYHWLERQLSFKVFSPTAEPGVIHFETTIEVADA